MILPALRTHLLSFTALKNKIGARVFINRAPDKTPVPYIILSSFGGETPQSLEGEVGIGQPMVQVAVWERDPNGPDKVTTVVELVRDKMSGWRGEWDDVFVNSCVLQGEPILNSEPPDDKSDNWWHSGNLDFQVTHRRAVPSLT